MKDFPVFTSQYGVASLILKEVPYRKIAYIHLRDSLEPEKLLEECVSFCSVCGAEKIYATGNDILAEYPFHTSLWQMRCDVSEEIPSDQLFPVTEKTVSDWRHIYNERMSKVPNAGTLEQRDEKDIIHSGGAYFVHSFGELLGIGWLKDTEIAAIAAVQPGAGERIMKALFSIIPNEQAILTVASTNEKAVRLYKKLGFIPTAEVSRWYQVK